MACAKGKRCGVAEEGGGGVVRSSTVGRGVVQCCCASTTSGLPPRRGAARRPFTQPLLPVPRLTKLPKCPRAIPHPSLLPSTSAATPRARGRRRQSVCVNRQGRAFLDGRCPLFRTSSECRPSCGGPALSARCTPQLRTPSARAAGRPDGCASRVSCSRCAMRLRSPPFDSSCRRIRIRIRGRDATRRGAMSGPAETICNRADPRSKIVDTVPFGGTWYWCQSSVTSVLTRDATSRHVGGGGPVATKTFRADSSRVGEVSAVRVSAVRAASPPLYAPLAVAAPPPNPPPNTDPNPRTRRAAPRCGATWRNETERDEAWRRGRRGLSRENPFESESESEFESEFTSSSRPVRVQVRVRVRVGVQSSSSSSSS